MPSPYAGDRRPHTGARFTIKTASRATARTPLSRHPVFMISHNDALHVDAVTKTYQQGTPPALADVFLSVAAGEVVAIMGPSGSGKSTLLNLIAGLDKPTEGTVTVAGERIDRLGETALARFRARHVGIVFQ